MTIMRLEVSALRDTGSPTSGDAAGMVRSFPGATTRGTLGGFRECVHCAMQYNKLKAIANRLEGTSIVNVNYS